MLNKCNKLRPHLKTNTRNSSQTQDIALLHTLTCSLSTFEDKHSGKSQTNATSVTLRTQDIALLCTLTCSMCTFEDTHSGKKPNKCTQWKKPNNTFETNTRGRFRLYTLTPVWHCLALLPFPLLQCHYCFNYDYIFTQVGILNVQMFEKSIRSVFLPNVEKKSTVIAQVLPHANLFIHFKLTQVCLCLWLRNNTLWSCWLHDCTHEFASFNADFQKKCLGTRVRFNMLKLVGDLQW